LTLPDGSVWTRVEFPEPLFALMLKAARSRGMDTMEFIEQAVYEKLAAAGKGGAR
jgi:hypothetical protein